MNQTISSLCEEFNKTWDSREYHKFSHAQINCIKILFQITSKAYPSHARIYKKIKDNLYPEWRKLLGENAILDGFLNAGMELIKTPCEGAFVFLKAPDGEYCNFVGLVATKTDFYRLKRQGLVLDKINNYNVLAFGEIA